MGRGEERGSVLAKAWGEETRLVLKRSTLSVGRLDPRDAPPVNWDFRGNDLTNFTLYHPIKGSFDEGGVRVRSDMNA